MVVVVVDKDDDDCACSDEENDAEDNELFCLKCNLFVMLSECLTPSPIARYTARSKAERSGTLSELNID